MARGKKKKEEEEPSPPRLPRNTITLSLDGTEEQVLANFRASQAYFRFWYFCHAEYRVRIANKMIYTCPLNGTFYYLVRFQGNYVVFIIVGRQYWLLGIWNSHGFFQSIWEDNKEFYMDSNRTKSTGFGLNHREIGDADGVDGTRMGIWSLRRRLVALSNYQGPDHPEPPGFREAWATYIIFIMETKFWEIMCRCCDTMDGFGRLGLGARDLVVNWKVLCRMVMMGIEEGFDSQKDIDDANNLLGTIMIYCVDAWNKGQIFCHAPLPPPPRAETWSPIDEGKGDQDIENPDIRAPLPQTPPLPSHVTYTKKKGGRKRGSIEVEDMIGKRAKILATGLRGGGVGGSAIGLVPDWFLSWNQQIGDEKVLNKVISNAKKEFGLKFVEAPALYLKRVEQRMQSLQLIAVNNELPDCDVKDIRSGNFISDEVIMRHFQRLTPILDDHVHLVTPATSMAFSFDTTSMDIAVLASSELIMFPVNNSEIPGKPDKGSHWSLMILYSPHDGSQPRLVHHDSTRSRINSAAAERLATSIRQVLPALQRTVVEHHISPIQQTGVDCAFFLMAIANSVAHWWLRRDREAQQQNQNNELWMNTLMRDVNQQRVTRMRELFPEFLMGYMTVEELNSICSSADEDDEQEKNGLPQ